MNTISEKEKIVNDRIFSLFMRSTVTLCESVEFDLLNDVNWNEDSVRDFLISEFLYKMVYDKGYLNVDRKTVYKYIYHLSKLKFKVRKFKMEDVAILDYFNDLDVRSNIYKLYSAKANSMSRALYAISTLVGFSPYNLKDSHYYNISRNGDEKLLDTFSKFAMFIYKSHKKDVDFYIEFEASNYYQL